MGPERCADQRCNHGADGERPDIESARELPAPVRHSPQQQCGEHQGDRVPDGLARDGAERRREVRKQQVTDHDARPQADAVEEEHRETEARGWPHGRNRAIEICKLEAQPTGQVIRTGDQTDRTRVQPDTAALGAAQRADPPSKRLTALVDVAHESRFMASRGSLELPDRPRRDSRDGCSPAVSAQLLARQSLVDA